MTTSREIGSALGLRGAGDYRIDGTDSTFANIGWQTSLAGFHLSAEGMMGRTLVRASIPALAFEPMFSSGFRLQADRRAFGGFATFGLTSPMHIDQARVRFTGPTGFDYASLQGIDQTRTFDLAPDAREMDLELAWMRQIGGTQLSFGTAYGFNAGNQSGAGNAAGWARLATRF